MRPVKDQAKGMMIVDPAYKAPYPVVNTICAALIPLSTRKPPLAVKAAEATAYSVTISRASYLETPFSIAFKYSSFNLLR